MNIIERFVGWLSQGNEPPAIEKNWQASQKPPSDWFDWFFSLVDEALNFIDIRSSAHKDLYIESFIQSGITTSINGTTPNQLDINSGFAILKQTDGNFEKETVSSTFVTTSVTDTTYYLYLQPDGSFYWDTNNTPLTNSVIICEVETDSSGDIVVGGITDKRFIRKKQNFLSSTIEFLSLEKNYSVGDIIEISGYHLPNDGAHHKRIKETTQRPGGVLSGDGSNYWNVHAPNEITNIKWFGAKGLDVSENFNDSPSIQDAFDYAVQRNDETLGGLVFAPKGKYYCKEVIKPGFGTKLIGESTGLVSNDPSPSNGTVFILSTKNPDDTSWNTTTLRSGLVVPFQILFLPSSGVLDMQDIGAIPEGNDSTKSIFCWTGADQAPYNNEGITQGNFDRIRCFSFNAVFRGHKFQDIYFTNCGLEYNSNVLVCTDGYDVVNAQIQGTFSGIHFANCVLFGNNIDMRTLINGRLNNIKFSSTAIEKPNGQLNTGIFVCNESNSVIENIKFSACELLAQGDQVGTDFMNIDFADQAINDIGIANCDITGLNIRAVFNSPTGSIDGFNITGGTLEDCAISIDYELKNYCFTGFVGKGSTFIKLQGCSAGNITGVNLFGTSHAQTYDIEYDSDGSFDFVVSGNTLTTKGLNLHPACARYKVRGNLNVADVSG